MSEIVDLRLLRYFVTVAEERSVLAGQVDYLLCAQLDAIRAPLTLLHRGRHNSAAAGDAVEAARSYVDERRR